MTKSTLDKLIRKALKEHNKSKKSLNEQNMGGCNPSETGICCCPPLYLPCCGPIELDPVKIAPVIEGDDCINCTESRGKDKHSCNACQKAFDKLDIEKGQSKRIKETEIAAGPENTKFTIKVDVSNKQSETKLGIRIQLEPTDGFLESDVKDKLEATLAKKLNNALEQFDMQVSKDTDVPDPTVIGFFIPLSQIKNMIVKSIKGPGSTTQPQLPTQPQPATPQQVSSPAPEPLNEMRVRDLNEISKVVIKEDFYDFINKGNNILRTLEEAGIHNGKKYLSYLVKHNIM
tara:strand:- start:233 stop:1096 length:864 start_codon:yes stop_codon:yes gene_type:complete